MQMNNKLFNKKIVASFILAILVIMTISTILTAHAITNLTITPSTAYVGSPVTISGSANNLAIVDIFMNGSLLTTVTAPIGGSFSTTITIPETPCGIYNITAVDTSNNAIVSANLPIQPAIIVSPTKLAPTSISGSTIDLTGTGFAANSVVTFKLAGTTLGTATADAQGSCTLDSITVPDLSTGVYSITGTDAQSNSASATFQIIPGITVNPISGNGDVGTTTTITGAGFAASSLISAITFISQQTSLSYIATIGSTSTSATGDFSSTVVLPKLPGGSYNIVVTDINGNHTFLGYYLVSPEITLTPDHGKLNDVVTVTGSGFASNSLVTLTFDGSIVNDTVSTDKTGYYTATFTVTSTAIGGHIVRATDASQNTASALFQIGIFITISPNNGTVGYYTTAGSNGIVSGTILKIDNKSLGTTVTVTGYGFTPDSSVTIKVLNVLSYTSYYNQHGTYDLPVQNVTTDNNGYFSTNFIFPNVAAGAYAVSATDAQLETAAGTFTVVPGMIVTPTIVQAQSVESIYSTGNSITSGSISVFAINGTDAMNDNGYTTQIAAWTFNGNGTLSTTDNLIPGFILPVLEPGVYTIQIGAGTMSLPQATITMDTLSSLNAELTSVSNGFATLQTSFGAIQTSLSSIDATVTSISDGIATLQTSVGTIQTSLSSINATVISISNGLATLRTSVGTIQTSLSSINATVISISNGIATLKTDVGNVQTNVSNLSTNNTNNNSATTAAYIAAIFAIIAAVAAVASIMVMRKKIAG